jgi:CRISPR-associated protein Csx10
MSSKSFILRISLLSDMVPGSQQGFGSLIDTDVVYDDYGLPYIPARRVKGCLREAAEIMLDSLKACGMSGVAAIFGLEPALAFEKIFGLSGNDDNEVSAGMVHFGNLYLPDYKILRANIEDLRKSKALEIAELFQGAQAVVDCYMGVRQQTRIDSKGVAARGSLRSIRYVKQFGPDGKPLVFNGLVDFFGDTPGLSDWLAAFCAAFRFMGAMRNRGFGEINCALFLLEENRTEKNQTEEAMRKLGEEWK